MLLLWTGDSSATLPFVLGGFVLKAAGAWFGAGGTPKRTFSKTA